MIMHSKIINANIIKIIPFSDDSCKVFQVSTALSSNIFLGQSELGEYGADGSA